MSSPQPLSTVFAFLPLLLATGIIGEFIKSIPITVSVTLIASLLIALMINHPLAAALERIRFTRTWFFLSIVSLGALGILGIFLKTFAGYALSGVAALLIVRLVFWFFISRGREALAQNKALVEAEWASDERIKARLKAAGNHEDKTWKDRLIHGMIHFDRIIPPYERLLRSILVSTKRKWLVLLGTGALFVGSVLLPVFGIVPTEFFPPSDEELIFVNLEAPVGLKLEETDKIVKKIEDKLLLYPEVIDFSTVVGNAGVSQDGTGGSGGSGTHLAGIVIKLSDKHDRNRTSVELADTMRDDFATLSGGTITVASLAGGPPSGASFEARISGDDLRELEKISNDLKKILADIPGTTNISTSLKNAPADYTFSLDRAKLAAYGLDATSVGSTLRMAISGTTVTTILRNNTEINVNATLSDVAVPTLADLKNIELTNASGKRIRLGDIATIELKPSLDSITRIDQKRTARLSAGVTTGTRPNEVLATFQKNVRETYSLPEGYTLSYGGENEQNEESVASILRALVIAIALIVATLIIQFNSVRQAVIVLATLPLAMIGVFIGMAIFGIALSFPGLIGILALFGIVVKNAIILIDKMNLNWKSGLEFTEGIVDAGKSRIEAIFITSFSTILGLIPITLSDALWRALGTAIIFGLAVSSFFTLLIIPILSSMLSKKHHESTPTS
ncbi:MAG: efflux RND transporter permease subunit [Candidatus Moraniibacteriota bacterium]|nr:MAG: efflux RND transporter permease subunit [Candidatus Moranbacteria bacterium]